MINIDTILTLLFINATIITHSETAKCTSLASTMSHYEDHPFYSQLKTEYDNACLITSTEPTLDVQMIAWAVISLFFITIILVVGAKKSYSQQ